jgi:hypothetical protein
LTLEKNTQVAAVNAKCWSGFEAPREEERRAVVAATRPRAADPIKERQRQKREAAKKLHIIREDAFESRKAVELKAVFSCPSNTPSSRLQFTSRSDPGASLCDRSPRPVRRRMYDERQIETLGQFTASKE